MDATRDIPNLDTNCSSETNQRQYGWHAHMGRRCDRCGDPLGPFSVGRGCNQELWGCGSCGVGVFCGEHGQPDINAAADMFVGMLKHA